jgi:hypothetical protein
MSELETGTPQVTQNPMDHYGRGHPVLRQHRVGTHGGLYPPIVGMHRSKIYENSFQANTSALGFWAS